jgi:hypothetical protein
MVNTFTPHTEGGRQAMPTRTEWTPNPPGARSHTGRYDWDAIVATLRKGARDHPGEWAVIPELDGAPTTTATAIREKRLRAIKEITDGRVEVRIRRTRYTEEGQKVCTIHLRFMPHTTAQ